MEDWVLISVQVLLVIAGGYYIYQAMIMLPSYGVENIEMPASFMSSVMVGVVLLGLAAMFQGIHQYRAKKRSIISV
jgi:hypothetical protein